LPRSFSQRLIGNALGIGSVDVHLRFYLAGRLFRIPQFKRIGFRFKSLHELSLHTLLVFATARLTHGLLLSIVLTFSQRGRNVRLLLSKAQADEFPMNSVSPMLIRPST
jgi:hypothetical protein